MTKYSAIIIILLLTLLMIYPAAISHAQGDIVEDGAGSTGECFVGIAGTNIQIPCDSTTALATWALEAAIKIAVSFAVLLVATGGYYVLFSQGQPDKISRGKEIITQALIGLAFIILSASILRLIGNTLIGIPTV